MVELVRHPNWLAETIATLPGCYLEGNFKLSSGNYDVNYIDLWVPLSIKTVVQKIAREIAYVTADLTYTAVGGPELASLPIADAMLHVLNEPKQVFLVRKRRKGYGTNKLVEGAPLDLSKDKALMVEDVVSTGASVSHAIRAILELGVEVAGVVSVVERGGEGAREKIRKEYGLELRSLTTLEEIREARRWILWLRSTSMSYLG